MRFIPSLRAELVGIRHQARTNMVGTWNLGTFGIPWLGFDPFVELRRMQSEMNRLFSGFTPTTRDFPPINIWLGENSVVVTSELPGVTSGDITINLQEDC